MRTQWPVFITHDNVRCFNCTTRLIGGATSGSPHGLGAFKAFCTKCQLWTWYDIPSPSKEA